MTHQFYSDEELERFICEAFFYVNIYGSYKLLIQSGIFISATELIKFSVHIVLNKCAVT